MPIFNQYDPGTASTFQYDNTVQQANADAIAAAKKKQRTAKILNTGLGIAEIAGGGIALATGAGAPLGVGLITSGATQTIKGLSMGDGGYMPTNLNSTKWKPNPNDLRTDGTKKGTGFLGVLPRPDGGVSSEISVGVEFDGKETEIPTLVPTLSKEEIDYLLTNPTDKKDLFNTPMGKVIMDKAINHAKSRINNGLSPFYQDERPAAYYNPYTAPYDPNEKFDMGKVAAPSSPSYEYNDARESTDPNNSYIEPNPKNDFLEIPYTPAKSLRGYNNSDYLDWMHYWNPHTKYPMGNGGMVNGGSHQSGHDLAIVDKNTGGDTGIRVEGGEMVFSKERTNALKHAYNQNDYNAVMRIVREQMHNGVNAHKLEGGTNELNLVPQGSAMNWNDGYPQNPSVINQIEYNTPYSTNRMVSDANELNIGTPINTKIQANSMNWDTGYANKFDPNIELAGMPTKYASQKDYGISPMQNPEMRLQQDYNAIGTGAVTPPSNASGSWMDYIKYAIPAIQTGLGAYASQTKLPEFTTPPEFDAMIALHKRQSGEGLSAQENMLLDRAIQDTYTTGLNKIYNNSGGNAGAILGNQNALAGDVLNAKIKQAALNADQRKKNQDTYSEDVAKQLALVQNLYNQRYAQAAGARAAGGNLMGVGLNNAQDMITADALKKAGNSQDNTFANALEEYFKNKNKK